VHLRGPDGQYTPVEQEPMPMNEGFIGGFHPTIDPPVAPPPPPKDHRFHLPGHEARHQRDEDARPVSEVPAAWLLNYPQGAARSVRSGELTKLSAVERTHRFKTARMNPHLQFMAGPLLRFDTIDEHGVWCGSAMIVSE
jgi:hypothetical protein